jgi:hypothetical protein
MQVQGVLVEQRRVVEHEKSALQVRFDEEKEQLQEGKENFLVEKLEVKEAVKKSLLSVTVVEIKAAD